MLLLAGAGCSQNNQQSGATEGRSPQAQATVAPRGAATPPALFTVSERDSILAAPRPIAIPADDGPHSAGLEWWYYHGHLHSVDGKSYGMMLTIFKRQGEQGRTGYVAHAAVTDTQRKVFQFKEEGSLPAQTSAESKGFNLQVGEIRAAGYDGKDAVAAALKNYGFTLSFISQKPAVLHGKTGFIGVSSNEASYYYSRTEMAVEGVLSDHGERVRVQGTGWMDHQWGDFSLTGGGGWDWFAVELEGDTELMVSVVRDAAGAAALQYGTFVQPDGSYQHIDRADITILPKGSWTSPSTNIVYPMGWAIAIPRLQLQLDLAPTLLEQEMDTRASVDRIYWEDQAAVTGTLGDRSIRGMGYVELTGYDKMNRGSGDPPR